LSSRISPRRRPNSSSDEATLALKKANHDRAKELRAENVVTQAAYDQARAEFEQAQSRHRQHSLRHCQKNHPRALLPGAWASA
jgi:multidrug resistance efflux pump